MKDVQAGQMSVGTTPLTIHDPAMAPMSKER